MTAVTLPTDAEMAEAIGGLDRWHHQCHAASLALVKSGVLPPARVARGACRGVVGQHSWVVVGPDCYALGAIIVDPTLWSYVPECKGIWTGFATNEGRHVPHGGHGSIWTYGRPEHGGGPTIELTPTTPLSGEARLFLDMVGPLGRRGWGTLMGAPVLGWPAAEIIAACDDTAELSALVPIDLLGMLTNRNPSGLYLDPERVP